WARNEADVDAGVDHVLVALARDLESPVVLDLLQHLGPFAADSRELDVVAPLGEVRQMRGNRPRTGADYPKSQLRHPVASMFGSGGLRISLRAAGRARASHRRGFAGMPRARLRSGRRPRSRGLLERPASRR